MKLCVFSDSHGISDNMLHAVYVEEPDAVVFLGDGERDLKPMRRRYPNLPIHVVCGNCDVGFSLPDKLILTLEGVRIFAVHGHRHDVKYDQDLDYLLRSARHEQANVVLFGHTHVPMIVEEGPVTLINPGSLTYPRQSGRRPSYIVGSANGSNKPEFEIRYV